MADVAFLPGKLVNPTEAALRWVELAQKGCKAWTDASLEVLQTYSAVAQTQRKTLAALIPPMALTPPTPAEMEAVVEEAIEAAAELLPAPAMVAEAMAKAADTVVVAFPASAPAAVEAAAVEEAVIEEAVGAMAEAPAVIVPTPTVLKEAAAAPPAVEEMETAPETMKKVAEPSSPAKARKAGEPAAKPPAARKAAKKSG